MATVKALVTEARSAVLRTRAHVQNQLRGEPVMPGAGTHILHARNEIAAATTLLGDVRLFVPPSRILNGAFPAQLNFGMVPDLLGRPGREARAGARLVAQANRHIERMSPVVGAHADRDSLELSSQLLQRASDRLERAARLARG